MRRGFAGSIPHGRGHGRRRPAGPAHRPVPLVALAVSLTVAIGCAPVSNEDPAAGGAGVEQGRLQAFVGATVFDGSGADPVADAVLVVRDGRIEAVGPSEGVEVPEGAEVVDLTDRYVVPGFINAHGHVGDTVGLESGHYSEENVRRQLALYARYGVTTVNSLGGGGREAIPVRAEQDSPELDRARLLFAGPVLAPRTPEEARRMVDEVAELSPDFVKIRVDDNLGASSKMPPEVYRAVIDRAHELGLRVATHLYYLEDAKALLRAGSDLVAHSVRDEPVDPELIELMVANDVCYVPTLTREVSTFVYRDTPEFFEDPFFRVEVDQAVLEALSDPERQRSVRESESARAYEGALEVAQGNLPLLAEGGVTLAMGTDSGPPARFQGYFEHLEMELMAEAGLTPRQVLAAATGAAASCLDLEDVGVLEPGRWADFVVLAEDPLASIEATRSIESVRVAGNLVPGSAR